MFFTDESKLCYTKCGRDCMRNKKMILGLTRDFKKKNKGFHGGLDTNKNGMS